MKSSSTVSLVSHGVIHTHIALPKASPISLRFCICHSDQFISDVACFICAEEDILLGSIWQECWCSQCLNLPLSIAQPSKLVQHISTHILLTLKSKTLTTHAGSVSMSATCACSRLPKGKVRKVLNLLIQANCNVWMLQNSISHLPASPPITIPAPMFPLSVHSVVMALMPSGNTICGCI